MSGASPRVPGAVDWGWAGSALEGLESGDLHAVVPFPGGALVALIDGLGHGHEAAEAARAAVPVLEAHPTESVLVLIQRCHDALRKTRGVVMSLASFQSAEASMTWIGVGNVDGVLLRTRTAGVRADEGICTRGGVVGYQLPPLRATTLSVASGDTLILATDGIRPGFSAGITLDAAPQEIAEAILARQAKGSDDAHVVVARFLGVAP